MSNDKTTKNIEKRKKRSKKEEKMSKNNKKYRMTKQRKNSKNVLCSRREWQGWNERRHFEKMNETDLAYFKFKKQ
jgi:hypothetical protein